jgi:hypothetical protein
MAAPARVMRCVSSIGFSRSDEFASHLGAMVTMPPGYVG